MITPNFQQIPILSHLTEELAGKWYCSYQEEYKNEKFSRYLGPKGWQHECYYWDSKPKMVSCFNFFGQIHLPVTPQEFTDTMDFRHDYERANFTEPKFFEDVDPYLENDDYYD